MPATARPRSKATPTRPPNAVGVASELLDKKVWTHPGICSPPAAAVRVMSCPMASIDEAGSVEDLELCLQVQHAPGEPADRHRDHVTHRGGQASGGGPGGPRLSGLSASSAGAIMIIEMLSFS